MKNRLHNKGQKWIFDPYSLIQNLTTDDKVHQYNYYFIHFHHKTKQPMLN